MAGRLSGGVLFMNLKVKDDPLHLHLASKNHVGCVLKVLLKISRHHSLAETEMNTKPTIFY